MAAGGAELAAAARRRGGLEGRLASVELRLAVTTREYRANDVLAVGLRERTGQLTRQLGEAHAQSRVQAAKIGSFQRGTGALATCNTDLTACLQALESDHAAALTARAAALKAAEEAALELGDLRARQEREADGVAAAMAAAEAARAAADERARAAEVRLSQQGAELESVSSRARELEVELSDVKGLTMLLGKTAELQGGPPLLPSDDAIWSGLGALGGLQQTLDVVLAHLKAQEARAREAGEKLEQLEDRLRSESAQRQAVAQDLMDAQLLYAKAVSDRESLETRTSEAESQQAGCMSDLARLRARADEDAVKMRELQEGVLALTGTVHELQPLAPRVLTLEAEKASLESEAERLDEALAAARRQLELSQGREAAARSEVAGYKAELLATLEANRQLLAQSEALTKRAHELEVASRAGTLAAEQLEAARRRLETTKSSMGQMAEGHRRAVRELESEVVRMQSEAASSSRPGSRGSARGSRPGSSSSARLVTSSGAASRPGTAGAAAVGSAGGGGGGGMARSRPGTAAAAAAGGSRPGTAGGGSQSAFMLAGQGAAPLADGRLVETPFEAQGGWQQVQQIGGQQGPGTAAAGSGYGQEGDCCQQQGPQQEQQVADGRSGSEEDEEAAGPAPCLPREVVRALEAEARERGAPRGLSAVQQRQVSALCAFSDRLRRLLLKQTERSAALEVQLLRAQEGELARAGRLQQEIAATAEEQQGQQLEILEGLLATLRQLRSAHDFGQGNGDGGEEDAAAAARTDSGNGGTDGADGGSSSEQPASPIGKAAGQVLAALRSVAAQRAAHQQLVAARREKAVQSDDPVQGEWLAFVGDVCGRSAVRDGAPPRDGLQLRACLEAVVRVYHRALHEFEAAVAEREGQLCTAAARQQAAAAATAGQGVAPGQRRRRPDAGAGEAAPASCLFDVLVAHYSQDGLGAGGDHSLWRDPEVSSKVISGLYTCDELAPLLHSHTHQQATPLHPHYYVPTGSHRQAAAQLPPLCRPKPQADLLPAIRGGRRVWRRLGSPPVAVYADAVAGGEAAGGWTLEGGVAGLVSST